MPKRLPARIIVPTAEPVAPRDRQIAVLRARLRGGSDSYLNAVAELAGWADRCVMAEAR